MLWASKIKHICLSEPASRERNDEGITVSGKENFKDSVGSLLWEKLHLHGLLQTDVICESGSMSSSSVLC